jgi:hypothetical protein
VAAFNSVVDLVDCPGCGATREREAQFRYGEVRQHMFRFGDHVKWARRSVGAPHTPRVVAAGWLTECPQCGWEGQCELLIADDIIEAVRAWTFMPDLVLGADFEVVPVSRESGDRVVRRLLLAIAIVFGMLACLIGEYGNWRVNIGQVGGTLLPASFWLAALDGHDTFPDPPVTRRMWVALRT